MSLKRFDKLMFDSGIKKNSKVYKQYLKEFEEYKALKGPKLKFKPLNYSDINMNKYYNIYLSDGNDPNDILGPVNIHPVSNRNNRDKVFSVQFYPHMKTPGAVFGFISFFPAQPGEGWRSWIDSSFQTLPNGQLSSNKMNNSLCWIEDK